MVYKLLITLFSKVYVGNWRNVTQNGTCGAGGKKTRFKATFVVNLTDYYSYANYCQNFP